MHNWNITRFSPVLNACVQLSIELVKKQQQLLLATERVKALETVRRDPTFRIMESAQRQPPSASPDSLLSTGKECLSFIADKCSKLVSTLPRKFGAAAM